MLSGSTFTVEQVGQAGARVGLVVVVLVVCTGVVERMDEQVSGYYYRDGGY